MVEELRPTGIDVIGSVPWGTHFCHFYETKKDLLAILVSYFQAGLENNEYCLWVTAPHITVHEALTALKNGVPDFDRHVQEGRMEILNYTDWYHRNEKIDLKNAVPAVLDRLRIAEQLNCAGLRANGDETWINRKDWKKFIAYERKLTPFIVQKPVLILCTYPLGDCVAAGDILDIALVHECTIARRKGRLEVLEVPEIKRSKAQIQHKNELLQIDVAERTTQLAKVSSILGESQSRLRTIFDTTNIAFLLVDRDMKVLTYNAMASQWSLASFGKSLKEGVNFVGLLKEDRKEALKDRVDEAMAGNAVYYETNYPQRNGVMVWYAISINPVKDAGDHIIGLCCSATNITAAKLAEFERVRISNDLVARNKDLEQFAYVVSHNLRAPLANIISLSNMLKDKDITDNEQRELEEFLFQSTAKLDEIVKDLNQILQIRRDIGEKKVKVTFAQLVNDILTGFSQTIREENIQIVTDFSKAAGIYSIKSYLYSIFYNLISNSIKYRQPDVPLVVEIRSWTADAMVNVTFKDNARGIDLSLHGEEVFGLYKRFNTDTEGKGIGLYMVQHQVAALGGRISIDSEPMAGSTFLVALPVS
jgi:PAS domain S-box-containing protein